MIRKPTSGDSEQREQQAERARRSSQLAAGGADRVEDVAEENQTPDGARSPEHGSSEGESAHGAIPRSGIDSEQ